MKKLKLLGKILLKVLDDDVVGDGESGDSYEMKLPSRG
jgi:hypothetical protein